MTGMQMLRRLLAMPLLLASASAWAQPDMQTPEQSFDLYARMLLEGDADAAAEVGASPRSESWEAAVERMMIGESPTENARTGLGRVLSPKVAEALRQTRCRSTGSERDDRDDMQIAIVTYRCQMPDYAAVTDRMPAAALGEQMAHDDLALLRVWIDLLPRAPKRTYTSQVTMARQSESDAWGPQDLPPLHAWMEMLLTLPE